MWFCIGPENNLAFPELQIDHSKAVYLVSIKHYFYDSYRTPGVVAFTISIVSHDKQRMQQSVVCWVAVLSTAIRGCRQRGQNPPSFSLYDVPLPVWQ
mmetsp:Transcript_27293/g.58402  ORF Transcript_27293/g.58402 Transcript_27293/m.58402 type:complete len:97 (+) Transcript_27293:20-310(+)